MTKKEEKKPSQDTDEKENEKESSEEQSSEPVETEQLQKSLEEANNKYIRLYADFENYKKVEVRNREELLKYACKDLMSDILTVIDHLELALQHSSENNVSDSLAEGVELTLKELKSVLEKHGLLRIDALGKPFDPEIHHAMSQIETEDSDDNTIVKEFRKGYMLRNRVLRAALVGVAKKQSQSKPPETDNAGNISEQ